MQAAGGLIRGSSDGANTQPGMYRVSQGGAGSPGQSYAARPSWSTGPRPMVHQYIPTAASRNAQQLQNGQQQQSSQSSKAQQIVPQTNIAPHLHPAYSGRGRPPLSLGRRLPSNTTQSQTTKKTSNHPLQQQGHTPSSTAGATYGQHTTAAAGSAGSALQPRSRKPLDGKEISFLSVGTTNRLLLSLRSGLPSHVSWALDRLIYASCHNLEALSLDSFPGMTDTLLRFPRRFIAAIKGEEVEKWEPTFWEQEEREVDGSGKASWDTANAFSEDDDDEEEEFEGVKSSTSKLIKDIPSTFQPDQIASHRRMLDQSVSAMLILRNLSMNERNERIFLAYSRSINGIICDILAVPNRQSDQHLAEEYNELPGLQEMRIYALDILEVTRIRLHIVKRSTVSFNIKGEPASFPIFKEPQRMATSLNVDGGALIEEDAVQVAKRAAAATSDHLFNLLVWHLHTTSDRSMLMGCLRCLGALAAEERNETAFIEVDVPTNSSTRINGARRSTGVSAGTSISHPGFIRKCLCLLPLTQDSALLEAALDFLYQLINIGDNALRLATCYQDHRPPIGSGIGRVECIMSDEDIQKERGIGDIRNIIRLLTRNLIYNRVVWDRSHQLTLHPALHGHIPSAITSRRKERDELYRRRKVAEGDEKERSKLRRLQRKEWLELKDVPEPERLKAWMKLIYESKEGGEVTQMEFWTTYSNQFGPYATLGGPTLQPAAEVIRTVSSVFPGALAMVIQNSKFIVRGVEARDRSFLKRFECKWQECHSPETETYESVVIHIKAHCAIAKDGQCRWLTCQYRIPDDESIPQEKKLDMLRQHVMTHLPETDEEIIKRDVVEKKRYREEDLQLTRSLKSQEIHIASMINGARYISGPTALMPNSNFAMEKKKMELERQEVKRRKLMNLPSRGTVDLPDLLVFSVTRTPMDPETSKPMGISSTSGLILRSLARSSATVLIKAGLRERRKSEDDDNVGLQSSTNDRFGLPLPMNSNTSASASTIPAVDDAMVTKDPSSTAIEDSNAASSSLHGSGIGHAEEWAIESAGRIMDALLEVEDQIMMVASENDILCPMLNETLIELKSEPGESIWVPGVVEQQESKGKAGME